MSAAPVFDKILIANRGEIACRVINTCRRMGIKTVAVFSTADEQAKHVKMADEAICVGPPASAQSYLRIDAIVDACKKTGAQAVHPGYGFLSENFEFSAALKENNIKFIGPDPYAIEAMGDKIHSKKLAAEANVTTIPGFLGEITSHEQLLEVSNDIGYPVMVKASGGGGGKGMRVASNDKECVEAFDLCKEEALAAFNNDKMLVEKFIENPRHVEVQVIADRKGNTLYLPERECSIQRRNQKVLEEAPSPLIDAETRERMGKEAAAMARKVDYVSAGTVEMVMDQNRNFYFLEMNTRLQVEHPITELITGVDLVEQMIRAAAGLELSVKQEDIKINGWATEARVYAEDPTKNYFPSIGRLGQYEEPKGDGVRVDSGILEGSQISVYYDPLISKLCTWGQTRNESLERMRGALDEYVIRGLKHNVCLLRDVITHERYIDGKLTTGYLAEEYPNGFQKAEMNADQAKRLQAVVAIMHAIRSDNMSQVDRCYGPERRVSAKLVTSVGNARNNASTETIFVQQSANKPSQGVDFDVVVDGVEGTTTINIVWNTEFPVIRATTTGLGGDKTYEAFQLAGTNELTYQVQYLGTVYDVNAMTEAQSKVINVIPEPVNLNTAKLVLSPMPGVIVDIAVNVGDSVVAGTELLTLEAMKMRNKIRCEVDGVVKAIKVKQGATVDDDQVMIEFE